jgi:hypothetical protein
MPCKKKTKRGKGQLVAEDSLKELADGKRMSRKQIDLRKQWLGKDWEPHDRSALNHIIDRKATEDDIEHRRAVERAQRDYLNDPLRKPQSFMEGVSPNDVMLPDLHF